jgi:hypothetical protein
VRVRQSELKTFQRCPLQLKFGKIDGIAREQSAALTFGTVMHEATLRMELAQDLAVGLRLFELWWTDPEQLEVGLTPTEYLRGTSWKKYHELGPRILADWWGLIQWEADDVIAREHHFVVPVGTDHELEGTVDKLAIRYLAKTDEYVMLVSDYKTSRKEPTYGYLFHDLQFTAYCFATTQPEFWTGIQDGEKIWRRLQGVRRMGEWVQLVSSPPRRKDAGERTDMHYSRLHYAIDQFAQSVSLGIYVPNLSGDVCMYCDFRKSCGLLSREDEERLMLTGMVERSFTIDD